VSTVDLSHPARTEQAEHFIALKFRAGYERHGETDYTLATFVRSLVLPIARSDLSIWPRLDRETG
jgi:hypothetical protein